MNKYLKNLNRLEFIITLACTGHCKHCSRGEHISNGEHIDGGLAAKAVRDICEAYDITSIMTFGGEPLLHPEDVCKIHAAAKASGIPRRSLITNGFLSNDQNRIEEAAHMLAENGVNEIFLSVDAFHQETIPIEPVMFFAECVKKEGIFTRLHPAWLVSKEDDNPYNIRTRKVLREFTQMDMQISSGNIIFPSGNARKYLSEYFDDNEEYVNPYKNDPMDVHTISFQPNGDVLNGNINRDHVMDIIGSYMVTVQDAK